MPRRRDPDAPRVVYRSARVGLRLTGRQRERCYRLLRAAGDVWACVLELNAWHRQRRDQPVASYQALCRELAAAGAGTFAELDSVGARSVLRRYSDAWFSAAARRAAGDLAVRYPRRRRALMAVRWYHGTFAVVGRRLRLPTARGCPPLWLRLDRAVPYPAEQIRAVSLLAEGGRLYIDVTAEVPITVYPPGQQPDPARVAGVDLGIIHPFAAVHLPPTGGAASGDGGDGGDGGGGALLVSGRAIRAEHRMHLADTKARRRATAARAPANGQRGSRRWRKTRRRARTVEGRHRRRVGQALHEATKTLIGWAVQHRIGTLTVGDPRGVLNKDAGRRHNLRLRQWQLGRTLQILHDKAALAGITVHLVNERGSSSTCPNCHQPVRKPRGRTLTCTHCQFTGHRDLAAACTIATRTPGGTTIPPNPGQTRRPNLRPNPRRQGRSWVGCSRTVEPDGTCPVPAGPGVIPAATGRHPRPAPRRQDPLAG